jgi:hypothetical protein
VWIHADPHGGGQGGQFLPGDVGGQVLCAAVLVDDSVSHLCEVVVEQSFPARKVPNVDAPTRHRSWRRADPFEPTRITAMDLGHTGEVVADSLRGPLNSISPMRRASAANMSRISLRTSPVRMA